MEEIIGELNDQQDIVEEIPTPEVLPEVSQEEAPAIQQNAISEFIDDEIIELADILESGGPLTVPDADNGDGIAGVINELTEDLQSHLTPEYCDEFTEFNGCIAAGCEWGTGQ